MAMSFDKELTAIQTWVKGVTGLNSWRLRSVPSNMARPLIVWDNAGRGITQNVSRYEYTVPVKQYGRLCVNSIDESSVIQGKLLADLGERCNRLYVVEEGVTIARLTNVQIEFTGMDLEGEFTLSYEIAYDRAQGAEVPHATRVVNRITTE